jgi:acyl-coenzyme A thioesterase PaaI-like protein
MERDRRPLSAPPAGPRAPAASGARLLSLWRRCERLPFGRAIFAMLFARTVPYSGSLGATVLELEPGRAKVALRDRRAVRNHLGSIHAVALTNLGELASGLAMTAGMPAGVRGIVRSLGTDFTKKARGTLLADCRVSFPEVTGDTDLEVRAEIRDGTGDVVAMVRVQWRLGLVPGAPRP